MGSTINHTSLQDAIPSSSPRHFLHGLDGRLSPSILNHSRSILVTIPLPEGPRSNIPFNPLTKWFALRYWSFMAVGFGTPFGLAVWQTYKNQYKALDCVYGSKLYGYRESMGRSEYL